MNSYFVVPGLGNSGPDHWQTHFQHSGKNFIRIEQKEWDTPACADWISNIDKAVSSVNPADVVLVGHSLGCTAIAYWAKEYGRQIKGAMLVAPSDVEAPRYTFATIGFDKVPTDKINFPTIVVTSTNDEWVSLERAQLFASNWGSEFINIGAVGHINVASGFGPWPLGLEILKKL